MYVSNPFLSYCLKKITDYGFHRVRSCSTLPVCVLEPSVCRTSQSHQPRSRLLVPKACTFHLQTYLAEITSKRKRRVIRILPLLAFDTHGRGEVWVSLKPPLGVLWERVVNHPLLGSSLTIFCFFRASFSYFRLL